MGEQAEVRRPLQGRGHDQDTNPLERKVLEFKFYAPGVGPVLATSVLGGSDPRGAASHYWK